MSAGITHIKVFGGRGTLCGATPVGMICWLRSEIEVGCPRCREIWATIHPSWRERLMLVEGAEMDSVKGTG
jgi:Zn-finger nucleic acid-binding protein